MEFDSERPLDAYTIVTTDAELTHLQLAVTAALRQRNGVLGPDYWRRRILELLGSAPLLPKQAVALNGLLAQIDEFLDGDRV